MLVVDSRAHTLAPLPSSTLAQSDILEREHLQRAILGSWGAFCGELGFQDLYLVGSEIVPHESCRDRIDMLALDPDGHPVVFELKRHRDKLQLLQAVAYAAMVRTWDAPRFLRQLGTREGDDAEELRNLLEDEHFELREPSIVLLAETFHPEVVLAAEWLSRFGVNISAFAISTLQHGGETLLSIDQRFPLLGVDDVYVSRSTRAERGDLGESTWDEALKSLQFRFARRAVETFRRRIEGSPSRRAFFSIYSNSPLGRMRINLRRQYITVYTIDQSKEAEEVLRERLGPTVPFATWGSEKTRNSGFTFKLETEEQFDAFLRAVDEKNPGVGASSSVSS